MSIVIEFHYMHRKCPCSRAYGLLNTKGEIKGVVTYGVPCSSTLLKGICGEEEMHNVYELNRLWVADDVPKNGESFLISNSMKDLDKEIIVSFPIHPQGISDMCIKQQTFYTVGYRQDSEILELKEKKVNTHQHLPTE